MFGQVKSVFILLINYSEKGTIVIKDVSLLICQTIQQVTKIYCKKKLSSVKFEISRNGIKLKHNALINCDYCVRKCLMRLMTYKSYIVTSQVLLSTQQCQQYVMKKIKYFSKIKICPNYYLVIYIFSKCQKQNAHSSEK